MADNFVILPFRNETNLLLANMRKKDFEELDDTCKANRETHVKAINDLAWQSNEAYSVFMEGNLLCCGGVSKSDLLPQDKGIVWLFSTTHANEYKLSYLKAVKKLVKRALTVFPAGIFTVTSIKYREAIKLNLLLGFNLIQSNIMINGKEHHLFFKRGNK